jgi:hypothetical protein
MVHHSRHVSVFRPLCCGSGLCAGRFYEAPWCLTSRSTRTPRRRRCAPSARRRLACFVSRHNAHGTFQRSLMEPYNGYSSQERDRKLRAMHKQFPNYSHPYYTGSCHMCGDPQHPVAPHSEDYSEPYRWERPAEYALCSTCHARMHTRFKNCFAWNAYKLHIKRGGYGADLKKPSVAREVKKLTRALEAQESIELQVLRPFVQSDLWWDQLTVDPASKTAAWARPR